MPRKHSKRSSRSHRSTLSLQKTEILINVYDLLPPGRLSTVLWHLGTGLLHSGVVINNREYAYGGHDQPELTGVYWTLPRVEPPGGTFRCEILHGFTLAAPEEIDAILLEASDAFRGTGYNLLTRNCNHFTSYLCEKLTGKPAPAFLNRAASIGVALPCVVPKQWVEPPDFETAEGELVEDAAAHAHGRSEQDRMLRSSAEVPRLVGHEQDDRELGHDGRPAGKSGKGKGKAPVEG
ncbi:hypothetical protein VTJ83DRAFT_2356 [Remersonia thermophila]|uniref:PPPDE domain-containing protein n=1 Tax=Remersonia thermophila TaxID=72144 RepID=A0ABR4DIK1_9PEZI